MSYNYLPLDRKPLYFQQVKNLLDYDQLVSITFDAHERILKSSEFLDNSPQQLAEEPNQSNELSIEQSEKPLISSGEEVPVDVVKLMLMLKIKSLSHGYSGVHIETVKRLMELYNNRAFPVIYLQTASTNDKDLSALQQLCRTLIGEGEMNYYGRKRNALSALKELNWQPINLNNVEQVALTTGTQFSSALSLYILKRAEQQLHFADAVAALSFYKLNCSLDFLDIKIHQLSNRKGQIFSAATMFEYLDGSERAAAEQVHLNDSYSFSSTPQLHGAARDTFDFVLGVCLKEVNAVTESRLVLVEENLVLNNPNTDDYSLALSLDYLGIAMAGVANISGKRTSELVTSDKSASTIASISGDLHSAAIEAAKNMQPLLTPASTTDLSNSDKPNFLSRGVVAANKCLQVLDYVDKMLAIELLAALQVSGLKKSNQSPVLLEELINSFKQQTSFEQKGVLDDQITKATAFVRQYKFEKVF